MIDWNAIRQDHLGNTEVTYLNSPANGIISNKNIQNEIAENEKYLANPGKYRLNFMLETMPAIKQQLAILMNAESSNIALIQNFSIGINFFVSSLPKNTKVALIKDDYPSLQMPFQVQKLNTCWFCFEADKTIDLEKLEDFILREKPTILAISHCQWLTGYLADLESIGAICKQHDCLFLVDATQSFGAIEIDVKKCNINVLGASCYKWALAGFGNGFLYVNESVLERYSPVTAGFGSYFWDTGSPVYRPSIKSYEPGHHDHAAFHRLHFALSSINKLGIDSTNAKINELMDSLLDALADTEVEVIGDFLNENRLGIVSIKSKPNLFKHLVSNNIEVSERGGNIRLGMHIYNNHDDVRQFINSYRLFNA